MIVMDTTDFMRKVVAPTSSPIGSSLSGKSQEEVEESVPLGNNVSSRGKRLEQINSKLIVLLNEKSKKFKYFINKKTLILKVVLFIHHLKQHDTPSKFHNCN